MTIADLNFSRVRLCYGRDRQRIAVRVKVVAEHGNVYDADFSDNCRIVHSFWRRIAVRCVDSSRRHDVQCVPNILDICVQDADSPFTEVSRYKDNDIRSVNCQCDIALVCGENFEPISDRKVANDVIAK